MRSELPRLGHEVTVCPDGKAALKVLEKTKFDAAILDLRMPGMTGIEVLEHLKKVSPDTEAVVMTGHASMETAIEAMRLGAFDYITKPCKLAEIEAILTQDRRKTRTEAQEYRAAEPRQGRRRADGSGRRFAGMTAVHRLITTVAPTDSTVLILGETGTGKELAARTLGSRASAADMPFVPVNCGAFAEHLVESELFGHRKGAFTGADRDHKGLFEVANGGTLFLDELGELNKNIQVKLLRFLESGEIRRVGETEPFKHRRPGAVRHQPRSAADDQGRRFREDLYFRINTFEIRLPPLRERRPDIPELARFLLARPRAAGRSGRRSAFTRGDRSPARARMARQCPRNGQRDGARVHHGGAADPARTSAVHGARRCEDAPTLPMSAAVTQSASASPLAARTLKEIEMEHLLRVLQKHGGNKAAAAEELGISLKTMYNKLNSLAEERKSAG